MNNSSGNKNIIDKNFINESIIRVINKDIDYNQYSSPKGIRELRIKISEFLKDNDIVKCTHENMLVTSGSQQSLNLVVDTLLNENDTILVEEPTFFGAIEVFKRKKLDIRGISINDEGINLKELEKNIIKYHPKLIYAVPTFNNPTGIAWNIKNRKEFLKIINKYNIIVIEDDPYFLINLSSDKYQTLYSLNDEKNVIYLGTFSKLISPSINIGYVVGVKDLIDKFYSYKESYDLGTSLFNQYVVMDYLENNDIKLLTKKKVKEYKKLLRKALDYFKDKGELYATPKGGIFIFVKIKDNNLLFKDNRVYSINNKFSNYVRINICSEINN